MSHSGRWQLSRDEARQIVANIAKLPAATSSVVRDVAGVAARDIASSWRSFHTAQEPEPKSSAKSKGGCLMVPVISANALLVWFVWGFFMAIGWALGTWVVARLLGMVWRERP